MITCCCGWSYRGSHNMQRNVYRCGAKREKRQYGRELCQMPQFLESALDAAIWPWLTSILREPEQALLAAQARAEEQQGQADRLAERLERITRKIAEMDQRIANLDEDIELERDAERRADLRLRRAERLKTRRELEAEHATLTAQQDRSPWACRNIERFIAWCRQMARQAEPATPEKKRRTYELANLQVRAVVARSSG
jgi:chromosome segregation ATPase